MVKIFILIVSVFAFAACELTERFDSNYKNYNEAIDSNSWKGHWLPRQLPEDAINILESHYVDSSRTIATFEFSVDFREKLKNDCKENNRIDNIKFANMNAKWWPNSLVGSAAASSHEYYYYTCSETEYFAIPFSENRAYFWRL
jgi:hypothetical protein